jgi:DNA repair exonuclease SbcCD ATPase subunit
MKLVKISWSNIGPFGNKLQTIELQDEGGLWMVLGKNGNGKSFLVNLPKVLYYGKLDKFKKDEIANRLNKHGHIKGLIETKPGVEIEIERSFSPSELIVYKNSDDIGKSGIVNYQEYIDNEVTGLPYHIFSNIISLSINDFKSFISMTPHDKRIIIDKLFAMEIINRMNDLVKKDLRDIKINMDLFDREIQSIKANINTAVHNNKN